MDSLSIVIPVYNSEQILAELFRRIDKALRRFEYELILVNDGSQDGSWEAIQKLAQKSSRVIGINLRKNSGQDNAIIAGLGQAGNDYIVIMDDDLQHSPFDIPAIHAACSHGFDICFARYAVKKQSVWKNIGSWLNSKVSEVVLDKPKHIYLSPFKIFRRELVKDLLRFHYPFPYVDGMLLSVTHRITQIEVIHHPRLAGKSTYGLKKSVSVFLKNMSSFSIWPLRTMTLLGCIVSLLGFIYGLFIFVQYFKTGLDVEGWTSLTILVLILGGVNLLALGMIGEYLGRTYLTINNRPAFSIKETVRGTRRRRLKKQRSKKRE